MLRDTENCTYLQPTPRPTLGTLDGGGGGGGTHGICFLFLSVVSLCKTN